MILSLKGYLTMLEDTFGQGSVWAVLLASSGQRSGKHPTIYKTAPYNRGLPSTISFAPRLNNPVLEYADVTNNPYILVAYNKDLFFTCTVCPLKIGCGSAPCVLMAEFSLHLEHQPTRQSKKKHV